MQKAKELEFSSDIFPSYLFLRQCVAKDVHVRLLGTRFKARN
jgi:hypothetical protein